MVIEYIKRNQKMGFDGDTLVYKVYLDEESPITPDKVVPKPTTEDAPEELAAVVVEVVEAPAEVV